MAITDGGYFIEDLLNAKGQRSLSDADIRRIQSVAQGTPMTFDMRKSDPAIEMFSKRGGCQYYISNKGIKTSAECN